MKIIPDLGKGEDNVPQTKMGQDFTRLYETAR